MLVLILGLLAAASAGSSSDNKETFKNQFRSSGHVGSKHKGKHESFTAEYCTDPRTMKKHPAYTEWADAYSCTRHRCQPGGRNLAIYTVGCKRVEAPESAIECEEVVEDTNMQFPFCCTRLRCLVVVRGEVWTRVLGQPWEVLPAAPWSHMYKMKKPPPSDSTFLPKTADQGPVYELSESDTEQGDRDKLVRSGKKANSEYNEVTQAVARAAMPAPDIVIALSTSDDKKPSYMKRHNTRRSKHENVGPQPPDNLYEEDTEPVKRAEPKTLDVEEPPASTGKPPEPMEENDNANINYVETEKSPHSSHITHNPVSWTEIPQNQWNEPKEAVETENRIDEHNTNYQAQEPQPHLEMAEPKESMQLPLKKDVVDRPSNLQALVDAIGSRMRDIESVVQKMSDKVHQVKPPPIEGSGEKRLSGEQVKRRKEERIKRPSTEEENYRRFSTHNDRGSKYLHSIADSTTEKPLFIEETNPNGYFSDASNSVLRRNNPPKEPPPTYMAPVETRRKGPVHIAVPNTAEDVDKKHKKRTHKKRKSKGSHSHKKRSRSKDEKRKRFNRFTSGESEKNAVSLDDSSGGA